MRHFLLVLEVVSLSCALLAVPRVTSEVISRTGTELVARSASTNPTGGSNRFLFPIEISVPDVINGFLSAFRYMWVRFQWLLGITDTAIVGAKDPPALMQLVTPSPALKAVPLAPDAVFCTPIKTVSVEVDDPVRHPYMHKANRRKRRKKRKKKRVDDAPIDWDMVALEAWALL